MFRLATNNLGFTLIELLVVVLILGILTAVSVPSFTSNSAQTSDTAARNNIRAAASDLVVTYTQTGMPPGAGQYAKANWDPIAETITAEVSGRTCVANFSLDDNQLVPSSCFDTP